MTAVESQEFQGRKIALHRSPDSVEHAGTLLLLHGYGADEHDLIGLHPYLSPELDIICIRAAGQTPFGGAAWFDITQSMDGSLHFNSEQALDAAQEINRLRREMLSSGFIRPGKLLLGGFSQGASVSMLSTFLQPEGLNGLLIMSGRITDKLAEVSDKSEAIQDLPVFVSHGSHDPVIPIEFGHEVRDFWTNQPARSEYHEYPMAHQIAAEQLVDIKTWLSGIL